MSDHTTPRDVPRPGVVEELARDDVERKRFLTMAGRRIGGGAAAASLAAFIAACGSSSSSSSEQLGLGSSGSSGTVKGTSTSTSATSASSTMASGDLAIVNYALTLEYLESQFYDEVAKSGLFHGQQPRGAEVLRRRGGPARDRAA